MKTESSENLWSGRSFAKALLLVSKSVWYVLYVRGERVLPPQPGCVLQSWSAPGRVESQQEPTDLPPWTFLPCTPPWASLRTGSSGGKVPSLVSPSPGGQTGTSSKSPWQLVCINNGILWKYLMHLTITLIYKRWCNKITLGVFLWAEKGHCNPDYRH